ncbi:MAG: hypothetical protein VYE73_16025 [Acidobacteriota bacterium]|nr:hypothetical protein [Acidobacteriota bacterium]
MHRPAVDLDRMGELRTAFQADGTVTAGNASNVGDGAAILVLATEQRALGLGLEPRAESREPRAVLRAQASVAQEPEWFTTAPEAAIRAVLDRAGLDSADIDLF